MLTIPKKTTRADLCRVLQIIESTPQAYHSQGPGTVISEIERILRQVGSGEFSGISREEKRSLI